MSKEFPTFNEPKQKTLQEQLITIFPDLQIKTPEEQEQRKARILKVQNVLNDTEITKILQDYSCNPVALRENLDGTYTIAVSNHFSKDRLPLGYGYRGSAARALLERALGIKPDAIPRDIDIVRFTNILPENDGDKAVLEKWIPEDEERRHGLETINDLPSYLHSRDFTINEVVATDTEITLTRQCLLDTIQHIIRVTDFENVNIENIPTKKSKLLAKALRLYSEGIYRWDEAAFANIPDWKFETFFISPFWLALQLDKACEVNTLVAETFVQELVKRGQLPKEYATVERAAGFLLSKMWDKSFYYRHAPVVQFEMEDAL